MSNRSKRAGKQMAILAAGVGLVGAAAVEGAVTHVELTDCELPNPNPGPNKDCLIDFAFNGTGSTDIRIRSEGVAGIDGQTEAFNYNGLGIIVDGDVVHMFSFGETIAGSTTVGNRFLARGAGEPNPTPWEQLDPGEERFLGFLIQGGGEGTGWVRIKKGTLTVLDAGVNFQQGGQAAPPPIKAGEGLPAQVPAPGSIALMAAGAAAVLAARRLRKPDSE